MTERKNKLLLMQKFAKVRSAIENKEIKEKSREVIENKRK